MLDNPPVKARIAAGGIADNAGEPILLTGLMMDGISGAAALAGEKITVLTRLLMTSDEKMFHRVVEQISRGVSHLARKSGHPVSLERADTVLLIIRPDGSGELWVDAAAMSIHSIPKRSMSAGTVVFENDLIDVLGISFPYVDIGPEDRVVCIIRVGWRFAFFADFNPDRSFDLTAMERDLGTVYRKLEYAELYDGLEDLQSMQALAEVGWFPFAEIIQKEFTDLLNAARYGWDITLAEATVLNKFDEKRLERMLQLWISKPHFASKEALLRSAIRGFLAQEPVGVIKIALTEIEGILNDAFRKVHGKGAKISKLLEFAVETGQQRTGAPDTLLLTERFGKYLAEFVFADFDPRQGLASSGSRHAVGHGAASPESYTMVRALQALLTLDQLALYT